jgi:hypothetical protein
VGDFPRKLVFTVLGVGLVFVVEMLAVALGRPGMGYRIGGILLAFHLWNVWLRNRWPQD